MSEVVSRIEVCAALLCLCLALFTGVAQAEDEAQDEVKEVIKLESHGPNSLVGQVSAEGLTYTYEAVPTQSKFNRGETMYRSKITVRDEEYDEIIHTEIFDSDPREGRCLDFPAVSVMSCKVPGTDKERSIVVFCGDEDGKHLSIKVMSRHAANDHLVSAYLFYDFNNANLVQEPGQCSFMAEVLRQVYFFSEWDRVHQFIYMYFRLIVDDDHNYPVFSFAPVFGKDVYDKYYTSYSTRISVFEKQIQESPGESIHEKFYLYAEEMVASLLGTQDQALICSQFARFNAYGVTDEELKQMVSGVHGIGFPDFDVDSCKEKTK